MIAQYVLRNTVGALVESDLFTRSPSCQRVSELSGAVNDKTPTCNCQLTPDLSSTAHLSVQTGPEHCWLSQPMLPGTRADWQACEPIGWMCLASRVGPQRRQVMWPCQQQTASCLMNMENCDWRCLVMFHIPKTRQEKAANSFWLHQQMLGNCTNVADYVFHICRDARNVFLFWKGWDLKMKHHAMFIQMFHRK